MPGAKVLDLSDGAGQNPRHGRPFAGVCASSAMIKKKDYKKVQRQLQEFLSARFEDVTVKVGDGIHYKGTNVVVTSSVFVDLLPEQRFHHVVHAIPPDFYEEHLRGGVVWFELAPGESGQEYMRMPRSDDVAGLETAILRRLDEIAFFDKHEKALAAEGGTVSERDFDEARRILAKAGLDEGENVKARLLFIRYGGFCDAEIPTVVQPAMADGEKANSK